MAARALHRYGEDPAQVAELFAPAGTPRGVAVVIHGGFWRRLYDRHLMDPVCDDLASAGWAAWNIEYRRIGAGGGWPATFDDVAAAVDSLQGQSVPTARVVAIGHSAGGHLALWAAARPRLPAGAPGAEPAVRVTHAVAQAGVGDLEEAIRLGLGGGIARELVGAAELPLASPAALVPLRIPQLLVHGDRDDTVPPAMSRTYARRARAAGDDVETAILGGVGHLEHLDPGSAAWAAVRDWLERL